LRDSTFPVEKTQTARIEGMVSSSGYKSELVTTPLEKVWQGATSKSLFILTKKYDCEKVQEQLRDIHPATLEILGDNATVIHHEKKERN